MIPHSPIFCLGYSESIFEIDDSSDDFEFYVISFSFIAITIRKDFKSFDISEYVFNGNANAGKGSVIFFFFPVERLCLRFLVRQFSFFMKFV